MPLADESRSEAGTRETAAMAAKDQHDEIWLRLPRDVALFLERTLYDVGEHIAGGREIVSGPPELERELGALIWDLRDALGVSQMYDADRRPSRSSQSFVVEPPN